MCTAAQCARLEPRVTVLPTRTRAGAAAESELGRVQVATGGGVGRRWAQRARGSGSRMGPVCQTPLPRFSRAPTRSLAGDGDAHRGRQQDHTPPQVTACRPRPGPSPRPLALPFTEPDPPPIPAASSRSSISQPEPEAGTWQAGQDTGTSNATHVSTDVHVRPGPARQPASGSARTGTGSENPAVATVTVKKQPAAGLGVQTTAGWMSCAISFRPQGKLEAR